jgi:hypothetical protein
LIRILLGRGISWCVFPWLKSLGFIDTIDWCVCQRSPDEWLKNQHKWCTYEWIHDCQMQKQRLFCRLADLMYVATDQFLKNLLLGSVVNEYFY